MYDRKSLRRMLVTVIACVALFLISSVKAYLDRGYMAVGGEYTFLLAPMIVMGVDILRRGE